MDDGNASVLTVNMDESHITLQNEEEEKNVKMVTLNRKNLRSGTLTDHSPDKLKKN